MATKETAAQKRARIATLLAHYSALRSDLAKLDKDVRSLKAEIAETVPIGTYDGWHRGEGTPRRVLDQPAARKALIDAGIEVPMIITAPSITVTNIDNA